MGVDLSKRVEAAGVSLVKTLQTLDTYGIDLGAVSAQVICAMDYSGSMNMGNTRRYDNGEVQELVERVLALSMAGLDDDGTVPLFPYDDKVYKTELLTEKNYKGFIDKWRKRKHMGGTRYLPVIQAILDFCEREGYFRPGQPPVFVNFFTDGSPQGEHEQDIIDAFVRTRGKPIFWQFIGLGHTPPLLSRLNNIPGEIDNIGFVPADNTLGMDDEQFYNEIISEFLLGDPAKNQPSWLQRAQQLGIVSYVPSP